MNITLDGKDSLQHQIYRSLRDNILSGNLKPNRRLPPSRALAQDYQVSRNTVLAAYDQLCAEGYLETRQGAGTYVSSDLSILSPADGHADSLRSSKTRAVAWSEQANRVNAKVPDALVVRQPRSNLRFDFLYGEPGYHDLPLDKWARIVGRCARELTERQLGYGPVQGLPELREALAEYLGRARGVDCDMDQIFIVQGTQEAIDVSVRALIDPGDTALLEEPHYRGFKRCLLAAGAKIVTVPVDESGIDTNRLQKVDGAKLGFVTPSHQFPLGSVMSLSRRQQLLDWANAHNTIILEDDYDGEFRYEGRPIPSLQSLDESGSVIYLGTTSKLLFPSLRLGWMVLPKHMVATFKRLKALSDSSVSILEQLALQAFIAEGHLERHVHKARRANQERREVLLHAIDKELKGHVEVVGEQAGIHLLLRFPELPQAKTDALIELAAQHQVGVYSASVYYTKAPAHIELLLGYASMTVSQIRTGVKRFAKAVRSLRAN